MFTSDEPQKSDHIRDVIFQLLHNARHDLDAALSSLHNDDDFGLQHHAKRLFGALRLAHGQLKALAPEWREGRMSVYPPQRLLDMASREFPFIETPLAPRSHEANLRAALAQAELASARAAHDWRRTTAHAPDVARDAATTLRRCGMRPRS